MKPVVVIKLGGSSLDSSETILKLATLIRGFQKRKYHVVVVHGGGPAINNELSLRKIKWQFINGQRQTTQEMMSVIDEVLAKKVNSELVETLKRSSVNAIGLSGADDQILYCKRASAELIQVGQVEIVNTFGLKDMWNNFADKVPVIAPIG
jgi:acetylglutamate kinase